MAGAPKGNHNALKHGLWAKKTAVLVLQPRTLRNPSIAIQHLEDVIEAIAARLERAQGEEFTRLANSLSLATTALFNGHRTIAFLTGGVTPVEEAVKELEALRFDED